MFLRHNSSKLYLLTFACLFSFVILGTHAAHAQGRGSCPIVLQKPWEPEVNEAYKVRTRHPVSGKPGRPHKGVDLNRPGPSDCNEVVALNDNCKDVEYTYKQGYGNTLDRDCGNGVTERYAHLSGYRPGSINIGTTGGSTGCHLHYEIAIDDETIDPLCVWGQDPNTYLNAEERGSTGGVSCPAGLKGAGSISNPDLCDPENRQLLKDDAKEKLGGASTGTNHASGTGDAPQTEETTTPSSPSSPTGDDGGDDTGGIYIPPLPGSPRVSAISPSPPAIPIPTPAPPTRPVAPAAPFTPACENSTCITRDTVDSAKHKDVGYDEAKSYVELTEVPEGGECENLTETGITIYRQKNRQYENYPGAFCINQGCAYKSSADSSSGSAPDNKCE